MNDNATLDYSSVIAKYPWILKRNRDCVLSPDSDGLLCGLFMSSYLGWRIRGFYDGKVLLLQEGYRMSDCVFLDMEIFRPNVRSIGQHMVMFNDKKIPENWGNFRQCISANNLRGFDFRHRFKEKYPFGTIHLLLAIVGSMQAVHIPKSAIGPLLYTDGTFKNLFNYPENCLSWLDFLGASNRSSPLYEIFFGDHYSISDLMKELEIIFAEIRIIGGGKRGGDKIKVSNSKGKMINVDPASRGLTVGVRDQAIQFLKFLAEKTGWTYIPRAWEWKGYKPHVYRKVSGLKPGQARFDQLIAQNPLSLAIISGNSIEHTLE